MKNSSYDNFIQDLKLRSFDSRDWMAELLDEELKAELCSTEVRSNAVYRYLYDQLIFCLKNNVQISYAGQTFDAANISYHKRFGWVIDPSVNEGRENELKVFLGKCSLLESTKLRMGHRSYMSGDSIIRGGGTLEIGSFCSIGEGFRVGTTYDNHPLSYASTVNFKGNARLVEDGLSIESINYSEKSKALSGVSMGSDVWVGRDVRVSFGAEIGHGCVIGERSLVRGKCEPYGIYAGTPAKLKRYRFSENIREQLLDICWWNWSYDLIQLNHIFFGKQLTVFDGDLYDLIKL